MSTTTNDALQPPIDFTTSTAVNQQALSSMAHIGFDSMRRALEMNSQFFQFVSGRLQADAHLADALSQCRSPQEAINAMTLFYQSAFDSWSTEIKALSERAAEATAEAVQAAQNEAKNVAETAGEG